MMIMMVFNVIIYYDQSDWWPSVGYIGDGEGCDGDGGGNGGYIGDDGDGDGDGCYMRHIQHIIWLDTKQIKIYHWADYNVFSCQFKFNLTKCQFYTDARFENASNLTENVSLAVSEY